MLKALLLFLTIPALVVMTTAQNLVPNPSFEDTTACDLFEHGGEYEPMLGLARPWFSPNLATPDVYSSDPEMACGVNAEQQGFIDAADGLRYVGLFMFTNSQENGGTKEYAAIRLQELIPGQEYTLTLSLARASFSRYSISSFGAYFSMDSIHVPSGARLPVIPQVSFSAVDHFESMEWTMVSGTFAASGGERFLYIGSFQEDADMDCSYDPFFGGEDLAYYNIDDVVLLPGDVGVSELTDTGIHGFINNNVLYWNANGPVSIAVFDPKGKLISGFQLAFGGSYHLPTDAAKGLYMVVIEGVRHQVLKWVKD